MQGPQPRGQAEMVCTFEIDANGLLKVSALDKTSGRRANITITNSVGRLSSSEIDQMINDAQRFSAQDKEFTARHEAKQELESYIASVESTSEYSLFLVAMVAVREQSKRDVASEFARRQLLSGRLSFPLTDFSITLLAVQPLQLPRRTPTSRRPSYTDLRRLCASLRGDLRARALCEELFWSRTRCLFAGRPTIFIG